jgi:hypothetical protein
MQDHHYFLILNGKKKEIIGKIITHFTQNCKLL